MFIIQNLVKGKVETRANTRTFLLSISWSSLVQTENMSVEVYGTGKRVTCIWRKESWSFHYSAGSSSREVDMVIFFQRQNWNNDLNWKDCFVREDIDISDKVFQVSILNLSASQSWRCFFITAVGLRSPDSAVRNSWEDNNDPTQSQLNDRKYNSCQTIGDESVSISHLIGECIANRFEQNRRVWNIKERDKVKSNVRRS